MTQGLFTSWPDVWLAAGIRTPFVDYTGAFAEISPIDLGIKAARAVLAQSGLPAGDVGTVIVGSMAQASFDAYMTPRHIGLYAGVPRQVPAHLAQRVCGTGIEIIAQAADALTLGRAALALCVGTESMSRNPIAAYTHRNGFKMGQVGFKDFLWEALLDPAVSCTMGDTAENLARQYGIDRAEVDRFAAQSFARALAAQGDGFLAGEITPVINERFPLEDGNDREIRLPRGIERVETDSHIRPSPVESLAKIRPAFGGVQTGGNSSAVVDGAAAALIAAGDYIQRTGHAPLARIAAVAVAGVDPRVMGIGPVPAIRLLLDRSGLGLDDIARLEINEAFGAQALACIKDLGFPEDRFNVNGGAIAIGHPLGATGVRLAVTVARELARCGGGWGIASACIGGGQGIALLLKV